MSADGRGEGRGVLDGLTLSVSAEGLPARVASLLWRDLGARVTEVPPTHSSDLVEAGAPVADRGVELGTFGQAGRFRDAPPTNSAVMAIGGAAMGEYSYRRGPVYQVTPFAQVAQGILAATMVLARRLPSEDVPGHLSTLQALFALQVGGYVYGPVPDELRWTHTPRGQWPSYATYRTSDGQWLFLGASTTPFMIRLLQALELDDLLADPRSHEGPRSLDAEITRNMWARIEETIASRPAGYWIPRINEFGVPVGPVLTIEEALSHPQVRSEGLVEEDADGPHLRNLVRVTKRSDGPVPRPGSGPLPLSGLRVLELTGYIAGSYTGRLLCDLGAESVVKVEPPGGDPFRSLGYGFAGWNYAKRGLTVDVAMPEGRQTILDLAGVADIFVTNYRAESLQRMRLTREDITAVNPTIIHANISAFGASGPLARMPGFDPIVQGFIGVMRRQGGDGDPAKTQMPATDYMSAMLATLGVIAARTRQVEEGGGYDVSTSLLAAATSLLFDAAEAIREGRPYLAGGRDFEGPRPLERLYQATDGWLLVTTPPDERDEREARDAGPEVMAALEGIGRDTVATAIERLAALGVSAVPAIHPLHLTAEPHFEDNHLWNRFQQGDLGELVLPAPVFRRTPRTERAPELGESAPLEDWWADVSRRTAAMPSDRAV